jgi:sulfur-carrier protein
VENQPELELPASTVNDLLDEVVKRFPSLRFHLLDADGNLRRHFNIFVNGEHIRELKGMDTVLRPEDKVVLLASAAGG